MTSDLSIEFGKIVENPSIFPTEEGRIEVKVTNEGNTDFSGDFDLKLYASTDNVLDLDNLNVLEDSIENQDILNGTDELLGQLNRNNFTLDSGRTQTFTINFADNNFRTASVVSPGLYNLFAEIESSTNSSDNSNNNRDRQLITQSDTVIQWNSIYLNAIQASGKNGGEGTAPPLAARNGAIVHGAINDTLSAINNSETFFINLDAPNNISKEAAVVGAAYQSLKSLFPNQAAEFDNQRQRSLNEIKDSESAEKKGFDFGVKVANQILNLRANDGSNNAQGDYTPGNNPGDWQFTFKDGETTDQVEEIIDEALLPDWGIVEPFAIGSSSEFRPNEVFQFDSPRYVDEVNTVAKIGSENSSERSDAETINSLFWAYDRADTFRPPGQWNQIAQEVALTEGNSLEENARLFGLLNVGLADAGIVAWDSKYAYEQLRPITAIREAAGNEDSNINGDAEWEPLLDTPPFPDYLSGHSVFGGAASAILTDFFGDNTSFEIPSQELPGESISYGSFTEAAFANADSRLFGGVHINSANIEGVEVGQLVGEAVLDELS